MNESKRWCMNQVKVTDADPNTFEEIETSRSCCIAHLNEGKVSVCPYTKEEMLITNPPCSSFIYSY